MAAKIRNQYDKDLWTPEEPLEIFTIYKALENWVKTSLWYHLKRAVLARHGTFAGIRVIEVGAGHGKISLMMNLLGADTTLVDYNEKVLNQARQVHQKFGCKSRYLLADALDLPKELETKFDISMSFGLNEHFSGDKRQEIFNAHFKTLKKNGLSLIQVPNTWGIFYRITHRVLLLAGRWTKDWPELAFTHSELCRLAENSGYTNIEVVPCASLGFDFRHFILGNMASFIRKKIKERKISDIPNWDAVPEERKRHLRSLVKVNDSATGPLSKKFASSIMLLAGRP